MKKKLVNGFIIVILASCNTDKKGDPQLGPFMFEVVNQTNAKLEMKGFVNSEQNDQFFVMPNSTVRRRSASGSGFLGNLLTDSATVVYSDTLVSKIEIFTCINECSDDNRNILLIKNYQEIDPDYFYQYTFTDEDYDRAVPLDSL